MTLRPRHSPEGVCERAPQRENGNQLNEIGQRRWIFKRVSAVGVEKSAAISAQLFDNFLRCDRALSDGLVGYRVHHWLALAIHHRHTVWAGLLDLHRFDKFYRVVRFEVLNHPLRD